MRVKNKSVPIVAVPESGERCHVATLDKYLGKLPPQAVEKDNSMCTLIHLVIKDGSQ